MVRTLNPQPSTLNPQPSTLNPHLGLVIGEDIVVTHGEDPKPSTLNPHLGLVIGENIVVTHGEELVGGIRQLVQQSLVTPLLILGPGLDAPHSLCKIFPLVNVAV